MEICNVSSKRKGFSYASRISKYILFAGLVCLRPGFPDLFVQQDKVFKQWHPVQCFNFYRVVTSQPAQLQVPVFYCPSDNTSCRSCW